ncbi:MAG: mechanosensitive ion channel [Pseudomonadales bacterium]|nr:mechanosensitive ion channel [Pseudomonadales bacterium]
MAEPAQPTADDAVFVDDLANQIDPVDWIPEVLMPSWEVVQQYPILGSLAVLLSAYLFALLSRAFFSVVLVRLVTKSEWHLDDVLVDSLKRPVFTTILFLGIILAVRVANLTTGVGFFINLAASVIIVSWMLAFLRLSTDVLTHLSNHPAASLVEPRTIPLFDLVIKLIAILLASYTLLLVWGINPVGWLASAGIVGIAVGFAAKDTLANLFSGLFILADSPYQIGDFINLDSGERGEIIAIGMRSTRLLTRSDVEITVPNAVIANAKITNESGGPTPKLRIGIPVGVAYGTNADDVVALLQETGLAHTETCSDPEPRVRMRAFGASSLDFELLCWILDPRDRGRIRHELLLDVYRAFGEKGIEIPYSKHDIYIKTAQDEE